MFAVSRRHDGIHPFARYMREEKGQVIRDVRVLSPLVRTAPRTLSVAVSFDVAVHFDRILGK